MVYATTGQLRAFLEELRSYVTFKTVIEGATTKYVITSGSKVGCIAAVTESGHSEVDRTLLG
jgi:hypothetical protein